MTVQGSLSAIVLVAAFVQLAAAETFTYWIEPCSRPVLSCEAADEQLAQWALQSWQNASAGRLAFTSTTEAKARIRIRWVTGREGLYGQTRGVAADPTTGADVYVRPTLDGLGPDITALATKDKLFRDTIIHLTALHELGHALGLPHTRRYADIMYNFAYGGDFTEYFNRYRRKLETRDSIPKASGLSGDDIKQLLTLFPATQ